MNALLDRANRIVKTAGGATALAITPIALVAEDASAEIALQGGAEVFEWFSGGSAWQPTTNATVTPLAAVDNFAGVKITGDIVLTSINGSSILGSAYGVEGAVAASNDVIAPGASIPVAWDLTAFATDPINTPPSLVVSLTLDYQGGGSETAEVFIFDSQQVAPTAGFTGAGELVFNTGGEVVGGSWRVALTNWAYGSNNSVEPGEVLGVDFGTGSLTIGDIPEPATAALLACGVCAALVRRGRLNDPTGS